MTQIGPLSPSVQWISYICNLHTSQIVVFETCITLRLPKECQQLRFFKLNDEHMQIQLPLAVQGFWNQLCYAAWIGNCRTLVPKPILKRRDDMLSWIHSHTQSLMSRSFAELRRIPIEFNYRTNFRYFPYIGKSFLFQNSIEYLF